MAIETKTERVDYIIKNWDKMTCREMADSLMITVNQVNSYASECRKHGIYLKKRGYENEINWDFILKRYGKKAIEDTEIALKTRKKYTNYMC